MIDALLSSLRFALSAVWLYLSRKFLLRFDSSSLGDLIFIFRRYERFQLVLSAFGISRIGSLSLALYPVPAVPSFLLRFFSRFGSFSPSLGRDRFESSRFFVSRSPGAHSVVREFPMRCLAIACVEVRRIGSPTLALNPVYLEFSSSVRFFSRLSLPLPFLAVPVPQVHAPFWIAFSWNPS